MRADVAKALLREAELCAANRALKTRVVGDDLYVAAEGSPTVAVHSLGDESSETEAGKERATTDADYLPSAGQTAEFTLPWRDATVGRYHRIF